MCLYIDIYIYIYIYTHTHTQIENSQPKPKDYSENLILLPPLKPPQTPFLDVTGIVNLFCILPEIFHLYKHICFCRQIFPKYGRIR